MQFDRLQRRDTYTVNMLVNFNGSNGVFPQGSLIADADGDLFGTTVSYGLGGNG